MSYRRKGESLDEWRSRVNAEENAAGCNHGMPPSDVEDDIEDYQLVELAIQRATRELDQWNRERYERMRGHTVLTQAERSDLRIYLDMEDQ